MSESLRLAREAYSQERYSESEKLLRDAIASYPDVLEFHVELGIVLVALGKENAAEKTFSQVLQRDRTNERAASSLGHLLENSLRCPEAERIYRGVLQLKPRRHLVLDDLCALLYSDGRIDESLTLARHQVEAFPQDFPAYDALRRVLLRLEDDAESSSEEDDFSPKSTQRLAKNLLEQLQLVKKLVGTVDKAQFNDDRTTEIDEELIRLKGELTELMRNAKKLSVSIPKALESAIREAIGSPSR